MATVSVAVTTKIANQEQNPGPAPAVENADYIELIMPPTNSVSAILSAEIEWTAPTLIEPVGMVLQNPRARTQPCWFAILIEPPTKTLLPP